MPKDRYSGFAIPAISGVGLGIVLLFIAAGGGIVFKRVKLQEA